VSILVGALYQYGKYNIGPRYGWFVVGSTARTPRDVASVDSGIVTYVTDLMNIWFKTDLNPPTT